MKYNQEMFERTLLAGTLSFIRFDKPFEYNQKVLDGALDYIGCFFREKSLLEWMNHNPERYYFLIASHALFAGIDISEWEKQGESFELSLEAVKADDSRATFRQNNRSVDPYAVDDFASDVFDLTINDFINLYHQPFEINNNNEYIVAVLCAFFVIGYNCKPEHFI